MSKTPKVLSPPETFRFFAAAKYRKQLIEMIHAAKPGDRVLLMSMTFEPSEPEIAALMHVLELAASRGVHVTLAIDAHSFMLDNRYRPGPLYMRTRLPREMPPMYSYKMKVLEAISRYPTGNVTILNMPRRPGAIPIAGRSHIKIAIVNNQIFLGGCNLQGSATIDMMIGWQSAEHANSLYRYMQEIIRTGRTGKPLPWADQKLPIDTRTNVLIDGGRRGQSVIFKEALQLIDDAERWLLITCQFFPNSVTAKHLAAAVKRGVDVEVVYAHPHHHGLIGGAGQQVSILRERLLRPRILFHYAMKRSDPMLHAKLIACDQGVMIGSHNYVSAGVLLGTAEIAFKSSSQTLAEQAVTTLRNTLQQSKQR